MKSKIKNPIALLFLVAGCMAMVPANASAGAKGNAPAFVVYSKPVCPGPVSVGNTRCNSWVVTNSKGVPKATGVVTYGPSAKGGNGKGPGGGGGGGGGSPTVPKPPTNAYGPAQWPVAYGLGGSSTETVGIVDAYDDPNIAQDLASYISAYQSDFTTTSPCTSGCFEKVNQSGGTTRYPKANQGWALEISLDVETVRAACPDCRILLVEANSSRMSDLLTAEQYAENHADVVSNSWGGGEFSSEASYDTNFNSAMPITFSSGDSGYGVEWPAASPNVTAVGGTSLSSGSWVNTAWSGSGSGCSAYESQPPWQTSLNLTPGVCGNRMVADVSADADPATGAAVYDTYGYQGQSGWFTVGGTSLASPLIASAYALAANNETVNDIYTNSSLLNDVTGGSYTGSCGDFLCQPQIGYDGPTGLGTPGAGAF